MATTADWQRVSPVAMLFFGLKSLPNISNLWPLLLGVVVAGDSLQEWLLQQGLILLPLGYGLYLVLSYWCFRFKIDDDRIHVQSGVLRRTRLTLDFDRVQQADITLPFYFRPFGLCILALESAGASEQEVNIPGLPLAQAEHLKHTILLQRQAAEREEPRDEAGQTESEREGEPDYQLRLSCGELIRYGLMHNGLLFLLPLMAPFIQNGLSYAQRQLGSLDAADLRQLFPLLNGEVTFVLLFAGVAALSLLAIALLALGSVLIALLRYWDYHLTRVGDQFQYRAGLTTIKTRGFRTHKLQQVTEYQGPLARLLQRHSVSISKAGSAAVEREDGTHFLVPVLTGAALADLKHELGLPTQPQWSRVNRFYIVWTGFGLGSTLFVLSSLALTLTDHSFIPAVASYPPAILLAWRRWQCLGYYHSRDWVAIKSGFIGHRIQWLPVVKVQKLAVEQPPWLRSNQLAHLHVWGANGKLTLPFLPRHFAERTSHLILSEAAHFRGRWI